MTLEQILFLIGLAFLLLGGIFILIFNRTKNEVFGWITIVFMCLFFVFSMSTIIRNNFFKSLPEEYQEKIKAIEDAQKDLQKFLIDHPEFIEVEK